MRKIFLLMKYENMKYNFARVSYKGRNEFQFRILLAQVLINSKKSFYYSSSSAFRKAS